MPIRDSSMTFEQRWPQLSALTSGGSAPDLVFLIPVFNDWASVNALVGQLAAALEHRGPEATRRAFVLIVDDGSDTRPEISSVTLRIGVLRLWTNLGHQRAIATGLAFLSQWIAAHATVVVMDGDGEDRPEDAMRLADEAARVPVGVAVGNRNKRSESMGFRLGYWFYKRAFRWLTGQDIRYGNFSAVPGSLLARLSHMPALWSHYAAALSKSGLPIRGVEVIRGKRYSGRSSMRFVSLVVHGLSAITVHVEVAGVRLLLGAIASSLAAIAAGAVVVTIRLFTPYAIPGWASVLSVLFLVLAALGLTMSVHLVFVILAGRERRPVIPALDAMSLIERFDAFAER
jgi:hypothetical protein